MFADVPGIETSALRLSMKRFYTNNQTGTNEVVVNETFLHEYGITNGRKLIVDMKDQTSEIVGEIKNIHIHSSSYYHQEICALAGLRLRC